MDVINMQKITITVKSEDGNRFVKTIDAESFRILGDDDSSPKITRPQGGGAGINLPKDSMGNRVIVIELK